MDHRAEVERWLRVYLGGVADKVDPEDVLGSIGWEGDDADELMVAFAARFSVDMAGFNPWHHYTADEPPYFRRYQPVAPDGRALRDLPISMSDLADSVSSGRWRMDYAGRELQHRSPLRRLLIVMGTIVVLLLAFPFFA
jgi:hypothetical protein